MIFSIGSFIANSVSVVVLMEVVVWSLKDNSFFFFNQYSFAGTYLVQDEYWAAHWHSVINERPNSFIILQTGYRYSSVCKIYLQNFTLGSCWILLVAGASIKRSCCNLLIFRNIPHIHVHEKRKNDQSWHGAEIQIVIEGNWTTYRVRSSLLSLTLLWLHCFLDLRVFFAPAVQNTTLHAPNGCHHSICTISFQVSVRISRVLAFSLWTLLFNCLLLYSVKVTIFLVYFVVKMSV